VSLTNDLHKHAPKNSVSLFYLHAERDEVMNYVLGSSLNLKGVQSAPTVYTNMRGTFKAMYKEEARIYGHMVWQEFALVLGILPKIVLLC
jgi:hypothetical protein